MLSFPVVGGWEVWLFFQGFLAALSGLLGGFLHGAVSGCAKKPSISTQLLPEELFLPPSLFPVFFLYLSCSLSLKYDLCLS